MFFTEVDSLTDLYLFIQIIWKGRIKKQKKLTHWKEFYNEIDLTYLINNVTIL
jgi:hypothetical protein